MSLSHQAVISAVNDLSAYPLAADGNDYSVLIYGKPWCRAAPYLVGLMLAFILEKQLVFFFAFSLFLPMNCTVPYENTCALSQSDSVNHASDDVKPASESMQRKLFNYGLLLVAFALFNILTFGPRDLYANQGKVPISSPSCRCY